MSFFRPQCPMGTTPYIIKAGDTYYSLAQRFNTSVAAIIAANPRVNPNALYIGQTICIPVATPPPGVCPPGFTTYIIRAGDTFYAIAAKFNTTVQVLMRANPRVNPYALYIGQPICVPVITPPPVTCPTGFTTYIIKAGDTLYAIAVRYNTTVAVLLQANPGINPNALYIGQPICVPVAGPPVTCPTGFTTYTIVAGDTLYAIAVKFNTTVDILLQANPGLDPNYLVVGRIICVPRGPITCPTGYTPYVVRAGDTPESIAHRFNTTVAIIQQGNHGIDLNNLAAGQKICVPAQPTIACPTGFTNYFVKAGDTLYAIAVKYNTTVDILLQANPGIDPNRLAIGQEICVPATS